MSNYTISNTDGSADYSSASAVETALSGTTAGHEAWFKCADVFVEGLDATWSGTAGTHAAAKAYYLDGGVPTEGVSGEKPRFKQDFMGDWTADTAVSGVQYMGPSKTNKNGRWFRSNGSGTTGSSEPSWDDIEGNTTVDNDIVWTCVSVASVYLYTGLLKQSTGDYFEFVNLQVSNYRGNGIRSNSGNPNLFRLTNLDFNVTARGGVSWGDSCDDLIIDNCTIEDCGKASKDSSGKPSRKRPSYISMGSGFASGDVGEIKNCTFQKNWQENTLSGIGTKNVHDNLYYAIWTGPYMINSQKTNLYNNVILGTNDSYWHRFTDYVGYGMNISNESPDSNHNGNHTIYNNLMAFTRGFRVGSTPKPDGINVFYDTTVVHNTFVDNYYAFSLSDSNYSGGGNVIKNNITAHYTAGLLLFSRNDSLGVTWDYNCWPSAPGGVMNGANDVIGDPLLAKESGWQALSSSTAVDATDFYIQLGSPAKDQGVDVGITTDHIGTTYATPPSIGAIEYTSGADTTPPSTPGTPTASSVTQTSMQLDWTASTDNVAILKYHLFNGDDRWPRHDITSNTVVVSGLEPNTAYTWKVRAKDTSGNVGSFSGALVQSTSAPGDTADPIFSGATSATEINEDFIRLAWTQGTDVIDAQTDLVYNIYQSTSTGVYDFTSPTYTTQAGVALYEVTDLEPGTYYFVVRCQDVSGNEDTNTTEVTATLSRITGYRTKVRLRVRAN